MDTADSGTGAALRLIATLTLLYKDFRETAVTSHSDSSVHYSGIGQTMKSL